MSDLQVGIDAGTWNLAGPDRHHQFTEQEAAALAADPPACPGCGEGVDLDFTATTALQGPDVLMLTGWSCGNDCESRRGVTGE